MFFRGTRRCGMWRATQRYDLRPGVSEAWTCVTAWLPALPGIHLVENEMYQSVIQLSTWYKFNTLEYCSERRKWKWLSSAPNARRLMPKDPLASTHAQGSPSFTINNHDPVSHHDITPASAVQRSTRGDVPHTLIQQQYLKSKIEPVERDSDHGSDSFVVVKQREQRPAVQQYG